jgi:NhaP-type Na+/H+ or K+/H+ antiporter
MDDSFQPTIDMLLNVSIFIWFGAICPWYSFDHNNVIPISVVCPSFSLYTRRFIKSKKSARPSS